MGWATLKKKITTPEGSLTGIALLEKADQGKRSVFTTLRRVWKDSVATRLPDLPLQQCSAPQRNAGTAAACWMSGNS